MKTTTTFLIIIFFAINIPVNSQWVQLNTGNGFNILDFSFPNASTGYFCGYGGLFKKTTNGGINWIDLSFPTTQFNINAIHFFNANTGLIASDNDTIYHTASGNQNWSNKIFIGFQVFDFQFFDSLNGYASGNNRFAKTTNGGLNWSVSNIQSDGQIFFINQTTGWTLKYLGAGSSNILETTDAGSSWQIQYTTNDFKILYDVFFANENTGYASGYRHCVFKTTDGGINWFNQTEQSSAGGLYSIYFINANTGWTVGDYYSTTNTSSYCTTNGGVNWIYTNSIISGGRLNRVKINNSPIGYTAGSNQNIYKTTNAGGLTPIIINNGNLPEEFSLAQNYPNPFNPVTKINYAVPRQSLVTIKVYDVLGKEVARLVNETKTPGYYSVDFDGSAFASGAYFYKLEFVDATGRTGTFSDVKKFILIK